MIPRIAQVLLHLLANGFTQQRLLEDIYSRAQSSIGLPVQEDSEAIAMFRVTLGEMIRLCELREQLEERAHHQLKDNRDFQHLQQVPGIGSILALTILAEAGDLRRFGHHPGPRRQVFVAGVVIDSFSSSAGLISPRSNQASSAA